MLECLVGAFKLILACFRVGDGVTDIWLGTAVKEGTKLYQTLENTEQISWLLENNMMSTILYGIGIFGVLVGTYELFWDCGGGYHGKSDDENNKWFAKLNIYAFVIEDMPSLAINIFILAFANGGSGSGTDDGDDSVITRRSDADGGDEAGGPGIEAAYISMGMSVVTLLLQIVKYCRARSNIKERKKNQKTADEWGKTWNGKNGNVSQL